VLGSILRMAPTARTIGAFERLIQRYVSQGAAPMPMGHREPPEAQGRLSEEAYSKMSTSERFAYAKHFDQKSMPAYRDTRRNPWE
jgi:hypothetical protein